MSDTDRQELTVLCCNVGTKYPDDWVYRLRDMIDEHISVPYAFVCISDHEIPGVKTVAPTPSLEGWWCKLDYFKPGQFSGQCLAIDLDVTVVGDVSSLAREHLTAARETRRQKKMNSSVMSWVPSPQTDAIWTDDPPAAKVFDKSNRDAFFGDQIYIAHRYPTYALYGDEVVMFKKHLEWGVIDLPEKARVVFFNGEPKPHRDNMRQYGWNARTLEGYELGLTTEAQRCNWDGSVGHHEDRHE
jgi:hypothetical protein